MADRPSIDSIKSLGPSIEFPQYLMIVDGKKEFMTLARAGATYDNGFIKVEIGKLVILDINLTCRDLVRADEIAISDAADAYSASK